MRLRAWTLFFVSSVFKWMPTASDRKANLCICFWRLFAPSAHCSQHQQEVQTRIFYHVSTPCNLDSIPDQTAVNRNLRPFGVGTLEMQFSHGSILITREISLFFSFHIKKKQALEEVLFWLSCTFTEKRAKIIFFIKEKKKKLVRLRSVFV